jgi:peroxiredoxin Q/BCP
MECKSLRESAKYQQKMNVAFFGASCDTVELNKKFAKKLDLNYPLLSDTNKKVAKAYGILLDRGFSRRVTFIIAPDGKIAHIFNKVNVKNHGEQIEKKLKELNFKAPKKAA